MSDNPNECGRVWRDPPFGNPSFHGDLERGVPFSRFTCDSRNHEPPVPKHLCYKCFGITPRGLLLGPSTIVTKGPEKGPSQRVSKGPV